MHRRVENVARQAQQAPSLDVVAGHALEQGVKMQLRPRVGGRRTIFDQTVTVANTTGYNGYLDLSSNTDFDNINYALIETESALISEVVVSA